LEILKDPRHGTFAIAGFAVVVVVWVAALFGFTPAQLPASLAFAAALARWGAVLNALVFPLAPSSATSAALSGKPPIFVVGIMGVLLGAAAWCLGIVFIPLVPIVAALALLVGRGLRAAFGGLTGDLYGFIIVLFETSLLVALEALRSAGF
jgi:cobalamin synthase